MKSFLKPSIFKIVFTVIFFLLLYFVFSFVFAPPFTAETLNCDAALTHCHPSAPPGYQAALISWHHAAIVYTVLIIPASYVFACYLTFLMHSLKKRKI